MTVYLIDSMSLVFRAFHALSGPRFQSPSGEPTGAVFGFTNILTSIMDREQPTHMACVFDTAQPTFRHKMYELYKANRTAFPEDLVPQMGRIKTLIDLLGIPRIELAGFEADDIVGTLALQASRHGDKAVCVTSDKDYFQLVDENVSILRPSRESNEYDRYQRDEVIAKFGVPPEQVVDVLAIMGDSSDNVPGVKGVGEKTAIPLVLEYGSLANIYEKIDSIPKEGLRKKLVDSRDMAYLSKVLVTIDTEVPIDLGHTDLALKIPDYQAIDALFAELGFNSLRQRFQRRANEDGVTVAFSPPTVNQATKPKADIDGSSNDAEDFDRSTPFKTIADIPHSYVTVDDEEVLIRMLSDLRSKPLLAFDLETTGVNTMTCEIVGISLCAEEGKAYYIPVNDEVDHAVAEANVLFEAKSEKKTTGKSLDTSVVLNAIKSILQDPKIGKIGQNAKFDMAILRRFGIEVAPLEFDTMLGSFLLDPDRQHGMDALSERFLHYKPISISALIGEKKKDQISMREVDIARVSEYAAEDADVTFKLRNKIQPEIVKSNLLALAEEIEFPLVPVLITMEQNGIAVNTSKLSEISKHITIESAELRKKIFHESGFEFNLDSPKQLGEVLFEKMGLPTKKKVKTGYSTDVSVLSELAVDYPIAGFMIDYRQLQKLQNTYVESLPRMINPDTKRIHTTYNQTSAGTGRLSSTEPNLQNIPIRTELGRTIRQAFVAQSAETVLLSADYSQIELRIMAHISGDETLIAAFQNNLDIHKATAAKLFSVGLDDVTSDMRRTAKTVNFGIMYGQGAFGLSQGLGITRTEAKTIIDSYFQTYPRIKNYFDTTIEQLETKGFVETIKGRRRFFSAITSANKTLRASAERAAINTPIQGSAADMIKLAMISIHTAMKSEGLRSKMLLQIHDELVFEVDKSEIDSMKQLVKEKMESALPLGDVPVLVEMGTGQNWDEAH